MAETLDIQVVPSLEGFFYSEKFIALAIGAVGSTKTTAGIQKILYHAARMHPCKDGIKRSRAIWVRQTREQLRDTSIPDFLKWFPDGKFGSFLKTEYKYTLKLGNIECEVLFRGLDDSNDVRRLLSMQASFAIFEEFRELNPDIFNAMQARLGRYPDGMMVPHRPEWGRDARGHAIQGCVTDDGKSNRHVWGMSNPPDEGSFWEEFLSSPPANAAVFVQPSGLSPEADWVHLLPSNYYEDLAVGKTQEYIDVYIHAKFGKSLAGRPVFRCFDAATHVSKTPLLVQATPVIIGVDAGLNPTAVLTQQAYDSRVLVLDAITGAEGGMGAVRFIRERLKPLITNKYLGREVVIIIDPAAFQRAQTDERSVADVFRAEGFVVKAARTNSISARISAGENIMTRVVEGKPALLIDPGCKALITALRSKYRYRMNTKGELDDKPEKLHPWSDYCFVAGTPISTPGGLRAIETLKPGDMVSTPQGAQRVLAAAKVSDSAEVWEWEFSDGARFIATPDHPVYVETAGGFIPLDKVSYTDILVSTSNEQRMLKWELGQRRTPSRCQWIEYVRHVARSLRPELGKWHKGKGSTVPEGATRLEAEQKRGLSLKVCGLQKQETTSTYGISVATRRQYPCISTYGRSITARLRQGMQCIMLTMTQPTTTLRTWLRCLEGSTNVLTCMNVGTAGSLNFLTTPGRQPLRGMVRLRGLRGTLRTENVHGENEYAQNGLVLAVERITSALPPQASPATAPPPAPPRPVETAGWMMNDARVRYAARNLLATSTSSGGHAVTLAGKKRLETPAAVYALQVENEPMYFAAGVLVKNCDSLLYAALQHDNGTTFGSKLLAHRREVKKAPFRWAAA